MIRGYQERAKAIARKLVGRAKPLESFLGLPIDEREQDLRALFDPQWYLAQYPEAAESNLEPIKHYLQYGARKGFSPSPLFDPLWYLAQNPDVAQSGMNPLEHYLRSGAREGRDPCPLFDTNWYLAQYPDIAKSGINPLVHFVRSDAAERRSPFPLFDTDWYLARYPDVAQSGMIPLAHYLHHGAREGYDPCSLFDTDWYLAEHPEVAESGMNPLEHYFRIGAREGYDPCPLFDTDWYLAQYPDVAQSDVNPLLHYLRSGADEGRNPNKLDSDFILERLLRDSNINAAARLFEVLDPASLMGMHTRTVVSNLRGAYETASDKGRVIADKDQIEDHLRSGQASHPRAAKEATPPKAYVSPYIAEFSDVKIYPGSMLVLNSAGDALHDELHSVSGEFNMQPKLPEMKLLPDHRLLFRFQDKAFPTIDFGLHLCAESDGNYFRWITEVLPRLFVAEQLGIDRKYSALVTSDLPEEFYELLDLVRHPDRRVIKLSQPHLYRVRELIYPSQVSRVLNSSGAQQSSGATYLPTDLLRLMARSIKRATGTAPKAFKRRLYLRGRSGHGPLVNQREVELSLVRRGFELVDLTGISARSQIELFSQAEIVISSEGAAFINLLWCEPSTKALVLHSDHPSDSMRLWNDLAEVADLNISYLPGPGTSAVKAKTAMHDDFSIDVKLLERRVDEFLNA